MKLVTTAEPYRQLVTEQDEDGNATQVVGRTPLEVSNEDADRIKKLGEANGVAIRVVDKADAEKATEAPGNGTPTAQPTPDLSAGVASVSGSGAPVTNDSSSSSSATQQKRGN